MARLLIVEDQPELAGLIGSAAQARGHATVAAHTGAEALALLEGGERFEAAIVDLLLPDMRGTEVLSRLQPLAVPSFAISGLYKGERFAREATETYGAKEYFEKPFALHVLLDAVEKVTGRPPRPLEVAIDELEELSVAVAAPQEPELPLPFADRESVWGLPATRTRGPRAAPDWTTAGRLAPGTLARLLNAYYQAHHTGELKLRQGQMAKVVFFENGQPVYAASNLAQERFARFCIRRGVITEADMAAVAALAKETGIRTGEAMIRLELLTPERRRQLLEEQIKEILWSTFSWTEGEYAFSPRRPARADLVKLAVFPGDLIMEGATREPLVVLRKRLPSDRKLIPAADPPYNLHEIHLGGPEAHLLVWADGTKTVEDLLALTDLPERQALGTLYGLELLGLLEERRDTARSRRISFGL